MGWCLQGYFEGIPQTDYGNGDPVPEVDLRNVKVPTGLHQLAIYYGTSGCEFFRGEFAGATDQAKEALHSVRLLTVYEGKYGGTCRLDEHLEDFVFMEDSAGRTYFFDAEHQPAEWRATVAGLLPPALHHLIPSSPFR